MRTYRLGELAERLGGRVVGDPERPVSALRTLDSAGPDDLSFLVDVRLARKARGSAAGAILTDSELADVDADLLICDDPALALIELLEVFYPSPSPSAGIHRTAVVGQGARIAETAAIGAYVVLGAGCVVEDDVVIHPFCCVGDRVRLGRGALLQPHVVLYADTEIGAGCVLHAGAVVGSDGFGYVERGGRHLKIPHAGRAVLEDDVEVGANSAVDRATLDETRIGEGTKIDNLVQVGHNVRIGRASVLCGQVGIAGSAELGEGVILAGQSGVSNRVRVGDRARVGGQAAVFDDVEEGQQVAGTPAVDAARWRRQVVLLGHLAELRRRIRVLEREVRRLEKGEEG